MIDGVADARAGAGVVTHRRMTGGATLYLDGTGFAIVGDGGLWFKADRESDADTGRSRLHAPHPCIARTARPGR